VIQDTKHHLRGTNVSIASFLDTRLCLLPSVGSNGKAKLPQPSAFDWKATSVVCHKKFTKRCKAANDEPHVDPQRRRLAVDDIVETHIDACLF